MPLQSTYNTQAPLPPKPVGVKATAPINKIQPTPNTLAKGFVEPYRPTPARQSTDGGTTGNQNFNMSTASGPAYAPLPGQTLARPTQPTPTQPPTQSAQPGAPATHLAYPAPQTFDPNQNGLYGALIAQLANRAQQPSPQYAQAQATYDQAAKDLAAIKDAEAKALGANAQSGADLSFQQGRASILGNQFAQQEAVKTGLMSAAGNVMGQANTQQQLQQQGLGTAIGATAPQQVGYNVQYTNPVTGQPYGGVQMGSNLQGAVSNVVEKLKSGQMTYNDALNALSGYGQGGINALQQSLPPGFNIAQSNTLGATQGQVIPAITYANQALDAVSSAIQGLSIPGQGSNIPAINAAGNVLSSVTGIGATQTQTLSNFVNEARQAIMNALAAKGGGTPSAYESRARSILPDNPTPQEVDAAKQTMITLGTATQNIYGNPGQSNTQNAQSTTSGLYNW